MEAVRCERREGVRGWERGRVMEQERAAEQSGAQMRAD